MLDYS